MSNTNTSRTIRAPRGTELTCRSWMTEAPYRMIQNNLDPEVAENPDELIVYGGIGKAARTCKDFDLILETLGSAFRRSGRLLPNRRKSQRAYSG